MQINDIRKYNYLGDRTTDQVFKDCTCFAVLNKKGKCSRGKNGNMLVQFNDGSKVVVVARLLRKIKS